MADPISIAGLIIQLISTAKQAYDFGTSIKNAREDIQDLFGELFALKAIVEQIRTDDEPFPNDKRYMIPENGPFNNTWLYTRDLLTEILDDLVNRASRGQSSLNHIGWPGKKSELREKITRLERLKTYFILVLMNDQALVYHFCSVYMPMLTEREEKWIKQRYCPSMPWQVQLLK